MVSGSDDRTTHIWDVKCLKPTVVMEGHTDVINCVAVSPNGALVATGSGGGCGRRVQGSRGMGREGKAECVGQKLGAMKGRARGRTEMQHSHPQQWLSLQQKVCTVECV